MKKILVYSILILGILILAVVPYWTGVEAEKQFSRFSNLFAPLGKLKIVDEEYQRGWLTSQAHSTFETQEGVNVEKRYFTLEHEIHHGFLPVKPAEIHTELKLAPQWQAQVDRLLNNRALLEVHTTLQSNEGKSVISMPPVNLQHPQQPLALQWQGLKGEVNFQQNLLEQTLTGLDMNIDMPGLKLITQHGKISAKSTNFQINIPYQSQGAQIGKAKLNFEQFSLDSQTLPIQLNKLQFTLQNRIEDNKLTLILDSQLQQLYLAQEELGPHQFAIELRHLHIPTLRTMQATFAKNLSQDVSREQLQFLIVGIFMQYGLQLMQHQPEIVVTNLLVNTPDGEIKASLQAKLRKVDPRALLNPLLLINQIIAKAEIKIPKTTLVALLSKTDNEHIVDDWLAHQVLVPSTQSPDHVYTRLTLTEGVLKANGNIVPITSVLN